MHITDRSKVEIDNAHQNDEQLVNVYDLIINQSSTLRLGASAHILGNYSGDEAMSGTLEIPAKRLLFADGTVSLLTNISIYDHEFDGIKNIPEKYDIYVTSGAGNTTSDGNFKWIDKRNGVYIWKECKDDIDGKLTHWWLIDDPDQTTTPDEPDKPTNPSTPGKTDNIISSTTQINSDKQNDNAPQTGVKNNLPAWASILGVSVFSFISLVFGKRMYRKKHNKNK